MAVPNFHIAVDGPQGTSFPSFSNSELGPDPTNIKLAQVRTRCNVSTKFFFTVDGKSRINDGTSLAYYMSLSSEGQGILQPASKNNAAKKEEKLDGDEKAGSEDKKNEQPEEEKAPVAAPGIATLTIRVTDGKTPSTPMALPAANENMAKLLESISSGGLERGKLLTFADRELAGLSASYAANPAEYGEKIKEPAEMTEDDWETVFRNTRAFHGYWYDFEKNIFVKASKRAFRLASQATTKPKISTENDEGNAYIRPLPPFYIHDDSSVEVTEIRDQWQHTLTKEGFNSVAVGGSIGGGAAVPVSVSASFEQEHSNIKQDSNQTSVDSLAVIYNFPRVVVEVDPEDLELSEECLRDAKRVTNAAGRDRFFRRYGTVFITKFTLGGYLFSTRKVISTEQSSLNQIKDQLKRAAGLSIQSPKVSGSLNVAKVDSTGNEEGTASLYQDARLTWDAHGGDTLLTSNPPAWATTVKNHRLWRLMSQERLVNMESLIMDVNPVAYRQLRTPTSTSTGGSDILKDDAYRSKARAILMQIFMKPHNNAVALKIEKYYEDNNFDSATNIEVYNAWMVKNLPASKAAIIKQGLLFGGTTVDQRVGLGLYMVAMGILEIS